MNKRILIVLMFSLIFICGWSTCSPQGKNPVKREFVRQTDLCRLNPLHTYQVYVPAVDSKCTNMPLIVVIDPHGAGKYAASQFEEAAQKYPAIVVASNLIKNNYAGYIQSIDELIADAKNKYPVGNRLFICGFSGGARMAIDYAMNHRVDGVIACGALAQPEQIKAVHCPLMAIVGMDDFNFIEAAQYVVTPAATPSNLLIELTNASHAWPEKKLLTRGVGYMQLNTEVSNNCIPSKSNVEEYVSEQKLRIDSLTRVQEPIKAAMVARNMISSELFEKNGSFRSLYDGLLQSQDYARQQDELAQSIRFELKEREAYYNALQQKDSVWWKKEISALNMKIETEQDIYTQMAFRRIKGFLGIVCYSLSNRYASVKDVEQLEQILSVYRMVEPENEDMKKFWKVLGQLKKR